MCTWLIYSQYFHLSDYCKFSYCYFYSLTPSLWQHLFLALVCARFRKTKHSSCRRQSRPAGLNPPTWKQKCTHTSIAAIFSHRNTQSHTHTHLPLLSCNKTHTTIHSQSYAADTRWLAQIPVSPWLWSGCSESTWRMESFYFPTGSC